MTRKELDELWARPNNWGLVYRCVKDPRVIVPRRRRWMGWTINFAHPLAWAILMIMVAVTVGPALLLLELGIVSAPWWVFRIGRPRGLASNFPSKQRVEQRVASKDCGYSALTNPPEPWDVVQSKSSRRVGGIWFIWPVWFVWFDERERQDRPTHQIDRL